MHLVSRVSGSLIPRPERSVNCALSHAHSLNTALSRVSDELAELNMEAAQTREPIYTVASGMSLWNVIDEGSPRGYTGMTGYKRVAAR